MTEISDLKRRVDAVGEKFGRLAEQENRYGERLAGLLNAVEEGFARSQSETQTLKDELESARDEIKTLSRELEAKQEEAHQHRSEIGGLKEEREKLAREIDGAKDESKQLRGMLLTLLEAVESGGNLDIGTAMRKLESRINRIVTSTDGPSDIEPAPKPPEAAPAEVTSAEAEPAGAEPAEAEPASADDDPLQLTARAEPAPVDTDSDEAEPVVVEAAASTDEPVTPAEPEAFEDLEEPKDSVKPKSLKKVAVAASKAAEPPSDDDLSAVNKIIQRISLLTGEFVEPSPKHSAAGQDKSVPSLKVDNSADDAGSPEDESTAKSR